MNGFLIIEVVALQFVLSGGAIIAILLMTFILVLYTYSFLNKRTNLTNKVMELADFGMTYSFLNPIPVGTQTTFNALDNTSIDITVKKEYWGIFEKRTSTANCQRIQFTKTVLIGNSYPFGISALYLTDKKQPLVLAGSAKISGNALLPMQGVSMGRVGRNIYDGNQLVYGSIKISTSELPKLDNELVSHLYTYFNDDIPGIGARVSLESNMQLKNSFNKEVILIQHDEIILENDFLVGNIIINASKRITVERTALLKDIILIAPEIIIKDKVNGAFQAIASKSIDVGKSCTLAYPTALVVMEKAKNFTPASKVLEPKLFVNENTSINGMVLYLDDAEKESNSPHIRISESAIIYGEIYCTHNLELKGTVNGNVTTERFIAMENGNTYSNYLYNGNINSSYLSPEYAGLLLEDVPNKKVMKWLQ